MKKKGIIALLLFIILCAGAGIFLLLYRQGGGTEQVAAPLPEEEAVVLADNMFYRDVPAEHLVLDEESGMPYVDDELIVAAAEGASWEEVQRPLKKYSPSLALSLIHI